jgi:hypothetical protein
MPGGQGLIFIRSQPLLRPFLDGADHLDVKSSPTSLELEPLLGQLLAWRPGWLRLLFALRGLLARLLSLKHKLPSHTPSTRDLMQPGGVPGLGEIALVKPPDLWVATLEDRHLQAHIILALEPLPAGGSLVHLGTVVRYRHWTGPLYFNLIRPFHHLVVWAGLRAAVRGN